MEAFISNQHSFVLFLLFIIFLVILSKSTDILIDRAVDISHEFGISQIIIGATIVSIGTSLPELSTSIVAVLKGTSDFALGNALGSVITNTALVLGVGTLAGSIPVPRSIASRLFFLIASLFILIFASIETFNLQFLSSYGQLQPMIGIFFLVTVPFFLLSSFIQKGKRTKSKAPQEKQPINKEVLMIQITVILLSAIAVALSATSLVTTVSEMALRLGISEAIIAGTIVALGTSLPELSTTYTAARKGHGSLAMGNILGANVLNILLVLGVSIAMSPNGISVPPIFYQIHFPVALALIGLLTYFIFNTKKHEISKNEGKVLISIYLLYMGISFIL